jgi:hypothetical protein
MLPLAAFGQHASITQFFWMQPLGCVRFFFGVGKSLLTPGIPPIHGLSFAPGGVRYGGSSVGSSAHVVQKKSSLNTRRS